MKFLVVGAGAVGGYFGARLAEKGEDVTFLVRENRQKQLQKRGLRVHSVHGDVTIQPKTIVSNETGVFDVILLGTKAYHLEQAIEDIRPFVHKETIIIPMLNGMKHIERLRSSFPEQCVIGGLCFIEATLSEEGDIIQKSPIHKFVFGEWNGGKTERMQALEEAFANTNAMIGVSPNILRDMWHKYLFISTLSGVTTLFRQPIGPIRSLPLGAELIKSLFSEIAQIMRAEQAPIDNDIEQKQFVTISEMDYGMKSSMQRDMEKGLSVEGDHLQGYLLELANKHGIEAPVLKAVYANLKLYEGSK
ncbi:MAG: ketopantoate reductase family protein [Ectobacillus sp.]